MNRQRVSETYFKGKSDKTEKESLSCNMGKEGERDRKAHKNIESHS